jgi:hypothetical protein
MPSGQRRRIPRKNTPPMPACDLLLDTAKAQHPLGVPHNRRSTGYREECQYIIQFVIARNHAGLRHPIFKVAEESSPTTLLTPGIRQTTAIQ